MSQLYQLCLKQVQIKHTVKHFITMLNNQVKMNEKGCVMPIWKNLERHKRHKRIQQATANRNKRKKPTVGGNIEQLKQRRRKKSIEHTRRIEEHPKHLNKKRQKIMPTWKVTQQNAKIIFNLGFHELHFKVRCTSVPVVICNSIIIV